jgi:hypothetical protein
MIEKYPTKKDVERHKEEIWRLMVLNESGYATSDQWQNAVACLRCDAMMYAQQNNLKKSDSLIQSGDIEPHVFLSLELTYAFPRLK